MENPTHKGGYTKEDLRTYAFNRKDSELSNIQKIFKDKRIANGHMSPEEHEDYRDPLAFSKQIVVHIELSTGGDADGFKLIFSDEKELLEGLYYWADWGVYEEVQLSDDELEAVDSLYCVSDWLLGI